MGSRGKSERGCDGVLLSTVRMERVIDLPAELLIVLSSYSLVHLQGCNLH